MKKRFFVPVALLAILVLFGCSKKEEKGSAAEGGVLEKEAWDMAQAGTLTSDPRTGYEYVEETDTWYYSNYPNYKDFGEDGKYKVAFVCKFSGAWFTPKNNAMRKTAEGFGYEYRFIDANSDEQAWLDGVQNIINQDYDAVILTPVNTTLMPEAVAALQGAGIAYLTTDDPGADQYGFYSPHYGLNDYYLHNEAGKLMTKEMKEQNWMDGVAADYSNLMVVVQDVPSVEAIHKRNVGAVDALKAAFPDIPESRYLWLDCGNGLVEEHTEKFSNVLQANKDKVKYWILSSGSGDGGFTASITLFREAGIDVGRYVRMTECMSTDWSALMMRDDPEGAGRAGYGAGLMGYPSGVAMVTIFKDLFDNGTPIPAFSPYAFLPVTHDTVDSFLEQYYAAQAGN
jgi:ABC-type sugar transport system substrate-binding protein